MGVKIQRNLDLADFKASRLKELNQTCQEEIEKGITSDVNGHTYRFNREEDQTNFSQKFLDILNDSAPGTILWKTEDAGILPLTHEEFRTVFRELGRNKEALIAKYWTLKIGILNATTVDAVRSLVW